MHCFLFLFTFLIGPGWAEETTLTAGDLPIRIVVPEGWDGNVISQDPPEISLMRRRPPSFVGVSWAKGVQPAPSQVDLEAFALLIQDDFLASGDLDLGEVTSTFEEIEGFGPTLLARSTGTTDGIDVEVLVACFAVASGAVLIKIGARTQDHADEVLDEVLDAMSIIRPALSDTDLGFGEYTADVGYTIDLPDHYRGLTPGEKLALGGNEKLQHGAHRGSERHAIFVEPSDLVDPIRFFCTANSGALEVLDPAKSALFASNYKTRTRAMHGGGAYSMNSGTSKTTVTVTSHTTTVEIAPNATAPVELIDLGDRDAYLWRVQAQRGNREITVLSFYTAWDNVGVDCVVYAEDPDDPVLGLAEAAFRSIRIVDGDVHPMRLSMNAQYLKVWPFTHPLLQIWWFGTLFCVFGVLGSLWVLRS